MARPGHSVGEDEQTTARHARPKLASLSPWHQGQRARGNAQVRPSDLTAALAARCLSHEARWAGESCVGGRRVCVVVVDVTVGFPDSESSQ